MTPRVTSVQVQAWVQYEDGTTAYVSTPFTDVQESKEVLTPEEAVVEQVRLGADAVVHHLQHTSMPELYMQAKNDSCRQIVLARARTATPVKSPE